MFQIGTIAATKRDRQSWRVQVELLMHVLRHLYHSLQVARVDGQQTARHDKVVAVLGGALQDLRQQHDRLRR